MKKKLLFLFLAFGFVSAYGQVFEEGFESPNVPTPPTWDLGTVNLGSDGIWGVFDNGVGLGQSWGITTGAATPPLVYEGSASAFIQRENIGQGNTSQDYLATPKITIPANGQLRFFTRTGINGDQGTKYKIMIAPSPDAAPVPQNVPANYVLVQEWTEATLVSTFNIYEEKIVDLSAYAGQKVYVAFVMEFTQPTPALGGDRWYVDKVRIGEKCLDPTTLTASNISENSATLSWANPSGASEWQLEIIPFAASPTGSNLITVTPNPTYVATTTTTPVGPLQNSTAYKYYVRAVCPNGFPSQWAGPFPFSTVSPGITCDSPIVIPPGAPYSTTDSTANYADLTDVSQPAACAGTATNYMTGNDVFYSYTPTANGAISITMTPTANWSGIFVYDGCANVGVTCVAGVANSGNGVREIPSLSVTAGHNYIIVISTNATPQTVGYTLILQELNCAAPTSLSATGTGPNSANLSWANPGGASSWEVFVQIAGSPIPSGPGTTANTNVSFPVSTLTGIGAPLELGTNYQYWVRADCGDGTFSPWAGPYLFNTTNCSSGCNYNFVMTDQFGGWEGNTMTIKQGALTIATIGSTFTSGTGPVTISVPLCDGPFELFWNVGGSFANEVGIEIVNSFGQSIFTHLPGTNQQGQTLYSGIVDCSNPLCLPPTQLSVAAETTFGATLSWTPNGPAPLSWDIYAVPAGDPAPTAGSTPTANTTNNPYTISGLLPDTTYVYYVRAVCSGSGANPWSAVSPQFTTLPTCPKPTGLSVSNIDLNQATFSWTPGGSETAWQVIVLPAGSTPPNAATTGWIPAPGSPFTVNGLTAGTPYDFYVRAVCSESDISTWAGPLPFNTSICPASEQCLYSFTMEDSFGDGWNGNTIAVIQNGVTVATLTGPATTGPTTVQIPLCHGVPLQVFWNTGGFFATEVKLTVTSFLGEQLLAFGPGQNLQGTTIYQGTAECVAPTCIKPTNVTVSNITLNSVTVAWTENNTPAVNSWDVIVLPANAPAPLANATGWVNVTTNPYTFSGLTSATGYKVYVRSVCSESDKSFWSLGAQFNTTICPPADLCEYTFIMVDTFGDGWNGNTMNVTQNGIVVAVLTGPTFADDDNPVSQTVALCNNVPFELFWNAGGFFATEVGISIVNASETVIYQHTPGTNLQNSQLFAGTVSCVPPSCPKPVQLTATNVGQTSATLSWVEATTATTWEVLILPAGSPAPTASSVGIITTDNPYQATGLNSGTQYVFYVRAICSENDKSNWAGPRPFATLITNDECANATVVVQNPDQSCAQTASGTLTGATASGVPNTCDGTADDDVWFQFVATSSELSIDLTNVSNFDDLYHVLYSGQCGTLTPLYCSDANQSIATGLVVGQTYYVRVYSWTNEPNQNTTFNICIGTIPPAIILTQDQFTPEQLISDILLNSSCAGVSAITYKTGTTFGDQYNGVGYFEKNGSSFPFDYGVVLSTGAALSGIGPNTFISSDGNNVWPGDADLAAVLAGQGITGTLGNATSMEFDFVPVTNQISFRFVFASEEYGTFQCGYSDVFAFLLTDLSTGVTTNLAVIPSTNIPISVTTIHDAAYNESCNSANAEYFGHYYLPPGESPLAAPINYNGCTVPMTAFSAVVPGNQYHIKLAIADFGPFGQDNLYDSAVFLEGGSFGIGNIDLGQNLLESTGNAVCAGGSAVLQTELDPALYNFQWSNTSGPIDGATGPSLTVTEEGTYTLQVNFTGTTCTGTDEVIVEFYDPVVPGTPNDLFLCSSLPNGTFDLTQNSAVLLAPLAPGFSATYYLSAEDANNGVNAITPANAYVNISNPQTIYARVENAVGCLAVVDFDLIIDDLTPQFTLPGDFSFCSNANPMPTISVVPGNFDLDQASYSWTLNTNPLSDVTSTITVTQAGLYEVTVNRGGCTATASVNVTMVETPVVDPISDVSTCGSYTLPALSVGGYFTAPDGGGTALSAGDSVVSTQTLWVYASSGGCTDQESFTVTVNSVVADDLADVSGCNGYTLLPLSPGNAYYTGPGATGTQLSAGDVLTSSQTVYVWAESGTVPNCTDQSDFTVTIGSITAPVLNDVTVCDGYTLGALAPGNSYYTGSGATGTQLFAGDVLVSTQTVYVWSQLGTCTDQSSFIVTVNQTPVVADPADVSACDSYALGVPAVGHYYGAPGGAGAILDNTTLSSSQTVWVYAATGTSPDCWAEQSFEVTVTPSPQVQDEPDVTPCGSYALGTPSVGHYYGAADGAGPILDNTTLSSSQTVWIYAANGVCSDQESFQVTILSLPSFTIEAGCRGADYVLEVVPSQGQTSYQWSASGGGQILQGDGTAAVVVSGAGQYTVSVGVGDCAHSETVDVTGTACTIQKGISPNGDGLNDYFDLEGQNVSRLQIFNRYGTVVYKKSNYTTQWHGQSDGGDELPDGTYYYVAERAAGETKTGWIYINRERN